MKLRTNASPRPQVQRARTVVRMERRLLDVLGDLAAGKGLSLDDLLEGVCLHAVEGKAPFSAATLGQLAALRRRHGLDVGAADSHALDDEPPPGVDRGSMELVEKLGQCALETFPHEDHVRAAWCVLRCGDLQSAMVELPRLLRAFATSKGAPDLYHETVTQAFLCLIHERIADAPTRTWPAFAAANRDLFDATIVLRLYPREVLDSPRARQVFVLPQPDAADDRD